MYVRNSQEVKVAGVEEGRRVEEVRLGRLLETRSVSSDQHVCSPSGCCKVGDRRVR